MAYCRNWTVVKRRSHRIDLHPLKCRCWTCDECAPDRKRRLVAEVSGGQPNRFITLTSRRREGLSPDAAARELSHAWRNAAKRLARKLGVGKIEFLAVFEETKLGWPHLHITYRGPWIDQRWLSATMGELIDSPVVHIRAVDNPGRAGGYVAKYIAKSPQRFEGCKRYWKSRGYELRARWKNRCRDRQDDPAEVVQNSMHLEAWKHEARGWITTRHSFDHWSCAPP